MRRLAILAVSVACVAVALGDVSVGGLRRTDLRSNARFTCYPAQFRGFHPRTERLVDSFGARLVVSLEFPELVCPPAPGSPAGYLVCYRTKLLATTVPSHYVRGSDELGPISARVVSKGLSVCMPAARVDRQPTLRARGVDPFTCYPLQAPAQLRRSRISVSDEFGVAEDNIRARLEVCASAGSLDRDHLLSCSTVDSDVKGNTVIVRENQYVKAALGVRRRLCTTVTTRP